MPVYTDATSVYDVCSGFGDPADLAGKTEVKFSRQSVASQKRLDELNRIDGCDNPADALTKSLFGKKHPSQTLTHILSSGHLTIAVRKSTSSNVTTKIPRSDLALKK